MCFKSLLLNPLSLIFAYNFKRLQCTYKLCSALELPQIKRSLCSLVAYRTKEMHRLQKRNNLTTRCQQETIREVDTRHNIRPQGSSALLSSTSFSREQLHYNKGSINVLYCTQAVIMCTPCKTHLNLSLSLSLSILLRFLSASSLYLI